MKFKLFSFFLLLLAASQKTAAQNVDVAVNITGAASVAAGGSVTYTVYVTNNGPSNAANVRVTAPAVSNFTASTVSCAAGPGNDGSASCPASVTVALLQGAGVVIPSLPYGAAVVFTVSGTASGSTGQIVYGATASVVSPYVDINTANNNISVNTLLSTSANCGVTTYQLNVNQTLAQNSLAVNGGTLNLVYSRSSGAAIAGLAESFTVPVVYSDLTNSATDNQWASLRVEGGNLILGMNTTDGGAGSVYNSLPVANRIITPNYYTDPYSGVYLHDRLMNYFMDNNTLEPLGTFNLNIGSLPVLPVGVYVASESLSVEAQGAANLGAPRVYSGYWLKPMIVHTHLGGSTASTFIPQVDMEMGQAYTWRYGAFRASGAGISNNSRGVIFRGASTINFAVAPRDHGNLTTTGSPQWRSASARMEATDLSVPRVWLGNNTSFPNTACADNISRNGGLTITGSMTVTGSGTSATPFVINGNADNGLRFNVTPNSNSATTLRYGIWFDANNNGSFTDAGDIFTSGTVTQNGAVTYNHPFTVNPGGINGGAARGVIRVVVTAENTSFTKAQNGEVHVQNGEVEDYYVSYAAILPVKLLNFEVQKQNAWAVLQWATASEQNNKGFYIERSADGQTWTNIGFVNSKAFNGNSAIQLGYYFTDNNPLNGKNYYRLKQTDVDGNYAYGEVRTLQLESITQSTVFPNPATHTITVSGINRGAIIYLYSITGQKLQQVSVASKTHTIDISHLAPALYTLIVQDAGGSITSTHKIMKQAAL